MVPFLMFAEVIMLEAPEAALTTRPAATASGTTVFSFVIVITPLG
jgi:hypothetical protein